MKTFLVTRPSRKLFGSSHLENYIFTAKSVAKLRRGLIFTNILLIPLMCIILTTHNKICILRLSGSLSYIRDGRPTSSPTPGSAVAARSLESTCSATALMCMQCRDQETEPGGRCHCVWVGEDLMLVRALILLKQEKIGWNSVILVVLACLPIGGGGRRTWLLWAWIEAWADFIGLEVGTWEKKNEQR